MSCSAAILAGGKSRRFGSNKALHLLDGDHMISRVHKRLSTLFDRVFVAGGDIDAFEALGLECYTDLIPGKDILSGLHTALIHAESEWVFCCACDMPRIDTAVIERILRECDGHDALIPSVGGTRQPLHALYRTRIFPQVERCCLSPDDYLPELINSISVRYLDESYFSVVPNFRLSFSNINEASELSVSDAIDFIS